MMTIRTRQPTILLAGQIITNTKSGLQALIKDVRLVMDQPPQLVEAPGFNRPMGTFEQEVIIQPL